MLIWSKSVKRLLATHTDTIPKDLALSLSKHYIAMLKSFRGVKTNQFFPVYALCVRVCLNVIRIAICLNIRLFGILSLIAAKIR